MTKKIDAALKDLTKALEHHAQVVSLKPVPQKKAGRAAAELRAAATAYAAIVEKKTGQTNPFIDFLDKATIDSLMHERDALAKKTAKEEKAAALKTASAAEVAKEGTIETHEA
ncbi:hypothetical protein [Frondihabitans cladoniiphilus]|uniref:Uncharacterized protein n=1 Tax=Frondihabitans cladoniiphilus TaxID=715785 RepID=A0ABP8VH17_9MICO